MTLPCIMRFSAGWRGECIKPPYKNADRVVFAFAYLTLSKGPTMDEVLVLEADNGIARHAFDF